MKRMHFTLVACGLALISAAVGCGRGPDHHEARTEVNLRGDVQQVVHGAQGTVVEQPVVHVDYEAVAPRHGYVAPEETPAQAAQQLKRDAVDAAGADAEAAARKFLNLK